MVGLLGQPWASSSKQKKKVWGVINGSHGQALAQSFPF